MSEVGQAIGTIVGGVIGFVIGGPAGAVRGAALGYSLTAPRPESSSPTYSFGTKYNTASQTIPIPVCYGKNLVAGNTIFKNVHGSNDEEMDIQIAVSGGPIQSITAIKADEVDITTNSAVRLGDRIQADNPLKTFFNDAQKFPLTAYISTSLTADENLSGNPTITSIVEGRKIQVYNGSTWVEEYSQNPAFATLDALRNSVYGAGWPDEKLDLQSFIDEAAYCDELIDDGSGGQEKRFQLDYVIDYSQDFISHLEEMLLTFRGFLTYNQGVIGLKIEKPDETPVQDFDMSNIVAGSFVYRQAKREERLNKAIVNFTDETDNFEAQGVYASLDGDIQRRGLIEGSFDLYGVNRASQAGRMAWFFQRKTFFSPITCEFRAGIDSIHCMAGDVVNLSHDVPGWDKKLFRILTIREAENDEMSIVAQEYNVAVYGEDGVVQQVKRDTSLPSPFDPPASVTNIQLTEGYRQLKDGTYLPAIEVTWSLPTVATFWRRANVFLSDDSGNTWETIGTTSFNRFVIQSGLETETYTVKVQSENSNGIKEDFDSAPTANITIEGKSVLGVTPVIESVTGGLRGLTVVMSEASNVDWAGYELYVDTTSGFTPSSSNFADKGKKRVLNAGGLDAGKTYYVKARMYDESSNFSNYVESSGIADGETVSSTIVIAASDSSDKGKAGADFVCDGTADNVEVTDAIASLPAGGGKIVLLEGNYYSIISNFELTKNNVIFEGQGQSTIWNLASTGAQFIVNANNITFTDITIDGGSLASTVGSKIQNGKTNIKYNNVIFSNLSTGINNYSTATSLGNIEIRGCTFDNNSFDSINISIPAVKIIIKDNTFTNMGGDAIDLDETKDLLIERNIIDTGAGRGITLLKVEIANIYNNIIRNVDSIGISYSDYEINERICNIVNNDLYRCGYGINGTGSSVGIYIRTGGDKFNCSGNTIKYSGFHGIHVYSSGNGAIHDNKTIGNDGSGIYAMSSSNPSIQHNICRKTGIDSIVQSNGIWIHGGTIKALISNNDCYQGGSSNGIGIYYTVTDTNFGAGNRNNDGTWSTTPN